MTYKLLDRGCKYMNKYEAEVSSDFKLYRIVYTTDNYSNYKDVENKIRDILDKEHNLHLAQQTAHNMNEEDYKGDINSYFGFDVIGETK